MADTRLKHQKIIQVGNSYAITIDKKFMDQAAFKLGEPVLTYYTPELGRMTVVKPDALAKSRQDGKLSKAEKSAVLESKITPEFRAWTKNFLKENKEAMEALANL